MKSLLIVLLASLSLFAVQAAPTPEGDWTGTLQAGGGRLRLALTIAKGPDGQFTAVLNSLDQGATIPADKVSVDGDKLTLRFEKVRGSYEGTLSKDGSEINGTWTQGNPLPLQFKRASGKAAASASDAALPRPWDAPVEVDAPATVTAFRADGKTHLAYELRILNFYYPDVVVTGVDAITAKGDSLVHYGTTELVSNVFVPGAPATIGTAKLHLAPGQWLLVFVWVTLPDSVDNLNAVEHRVSVKVGNDANEFTVRCARAGIDRELPVISAPLRGDLWLAANGPGNSSGHRRALITLAGRGYIAQRFAIDWVRLFPDGATHHGDAKDNKNYRAHGSEALAVADGVVTEIKDGIPENVPGRDSRAVPITLETIGGNHVILDIGHGRYAFYAHLQPGSLKVKLGDRVKTGQVLGLVGNSGNSTEPHLHFHISDTNSPLGSEGMPYELQSFDAFHSDQGNFKPDTPVVQHKAELPLQNEVVKFADRP